MIDYIKKKWLFFLTFAIVSIVASWLLYSKAAHLYKFNLEIKLILKQNKRVEAIVVERHYTRKKADTYWFRTYQGDKYYAKLSASFKNPDIGDKLVILIADDIKLCLVEDIKYKQILSYKYHLFYDMIISGLSFGFSMLMLIMLILDMFREVKNK